MDINTQLTKGIQVGADMRMIFIDDQTREGEPNFNTFFQMQGDLYINAKINKYLNLVIAPGLYIPNTYGSNPLPTKYEIYGMVSNLPAGLFFKVGRFIQNFGLKLPEHRAYQRQYNDFYTPYASDAGIEVGITPSYFTLTAGLSNGSSYNKDRQNNNSFDFDNQRQAVVSGDFRWAAKDNRFTVGLGGSFLNNPYKYDAVNNINALRQIGAAFVSFGIFERAALIGELSYNKLDIRDSLSTRAETRMIFGELDIIVYKGLELKSQFEEYTPVKLLPDGISKRRRYSFGAVFYPLTGLEIESVFRIVEEPNDNAETKNNEFQTVFKFYF